MGCCLQGSQGGCDRQCRGYLAAASVPHSVPTGRAWWPEPSTSALEPPRAPSQGAASHPGAPGLARAAQNLLGPTSLSTGGVGGPSTRHSMAGGNLWLETLHWEGAGAEGPAGHFLGVQSWPISGGSLSPHCQILGTLSQGQSTPPVRQKGGATAAPHCTCAKVEDPSDLSSS